MEYKFEIRDNYYCLIFSDGVVLEKDSRHIGQIDRKAKRPMVLTNFKRPDERWICYSLWSNGTIEKYELKRCPCLLPREQKGLSPVDYEMYVLLFQNWVKKEKIDYLDGQIALEDVVGQFAEEGNQWLGDMVHHEFRCKECKDKLILSLDTYRGGGQGFYRKE